MATRGQTRTTPAPKVNWRVRIVDGQWQWFLPRLWTDDLAWAEIESEDNSRWSGFWFRVTFDKGAVASFDVHRSSDAPPLIARTLQAVPMKAIEDTARAVISGWVSAWLDQRGAWLDDRQHRKWLDEFDPTDRSDRDLFLARVADRYVQTIGDREQISKISGEFVVAPGTVKELIKEARSSDVLSKTTQGRAGGHLTAKAIQLLAGKSAVEIVVEKFGWTEGDAREIVDLIDQAGELDHRLAYFASLPAQDLEERAAAHSRAVEDEKRFVALRAARDSGDITREEYLQRFNQMVAPYMVGI